MTSNPSQERLEQIRFLMNSGQRQHAANMLSIFLMSNANNLEAWRMLAEASSEIDVVRNALVNILRLQPNDPYAIDALQQIERQQAQGLIPVPQPPPVMSDSQRITSAPFGSMSDSQRVTPPPFGTTSDSQQYTPTQFGGTSDSQRLNTPPAFGGATGSYTPPPVANNPTGGYTPPQTDSMQFSGAAFGSSSANFALQQPMEFPALEAREVALRRRSGSDYQRVRSSVASNDFGSGTRWVIILVAIVAIAGCGLLTYAVVSGVNLVGQAVSEIQMPSFSFSVPSQIVLPGVSIQTGAGGGDGNVAVTATPYIPTGGSTGELITLFQGTIGYGDFRVQTLENTPHSWTFTGNVGQFVLIETQAMDASLNPALTLFNIDGSQLMTVRDNSPTDLNARIALTLPADGTYSIVISSEAGRGDYQIALRQG